MARRSGQVAAIGLSFFIVILALVILPMRAVAAPYAAFVMDARTGEVLHAQNADTRLHPASLTKMMTLYIAFQAIDRGEITLDTDVTITAQAADEPPSKLGLRAGQQIRLRYLIRAAAVRSANDAATAIGIAISGSEEAFATRMNRTAAAMGMANTTFRNAHGLTETGHLSTARDMSILGRHVIYDFPQYYNLFSRRSADVGVATVQHTNRQWLDSYQGGDGIKTGYTRAAGFTLVASAERGDKRIIATVFGGTSTAARNARITELMDLGFRAAPAQARVSAPRAPEPAVAPARAIVTSSYRPVARPVAAPAMVAAAAETVDQDMINALLAQTIAPAVAEAVVAPAPPPPPVALAAAPAITPQARPIPAPQVAAPAIAADQEVVTRISTSGGRHWGINVGRYPSRFEAERILLQVALNEMSTLDGSLRRVVQRSGGFDANFMGLSREGADLACRRLQARGTTCFMIGADS